MSTVSTKDISLVSVRQTMTVYVCYLLDLSYPIDETIFTRVAHHRCYLERHHLQWRHQPLPPAHLPGCYRCPRWCDRDC